MLMDFPRHALLRPLTRNEVVGMLVRLTIFGAATYYSIRWVVEALDPTQRQKSNAKKRVKFTRVGFTWVSFGWMGFTWDLWSFMGFTGVLWS